MLRQGMLLLIYVVGISWTTSVGMSLPVPSATKNIVNRSGSNPVLSPLAHAAVLEASENKSEAGQEKNKRFLEGIQKQFSNLINSPNSAKINMTEDAVTTTTMVLPSPFVHHVGSVEGKNFSGLSERQSKEANMRGLNVSLASSPADLHAYEGGISISGLVKGISSSVVDVGSNVKKALFKDKEASYKVVAKNRTMVVARVTGTRIGGIEKDDVRVTPKKVYMDGKKVVVVVPVEAKGPQRAESKKKLVGEEKEYRIKVGGKYKVWAEEVYLKVGGRGKATKSFDIVIPIEKKKGAVKSLFRDKGKEKEESNAEEEDSAEFLRIQMRCQKKYGVSGIRRMVCTCEKMHNENSDGGSKCVTRIAEKVMRIANDLGANRTIRKVYRGAKKCKRKKEMKARHDCIVKLLEELAGEGSEFGTKHGRSILSSERVEAGRVDKRVGELMVAGDFEEEHDEGEVEEDEQTQDARNLLSSNGVVIEVIKYCAFAVAVGLVGLCMYELKRKYGMYRRHRGRSTVG